MPQTPAQVDRAHQPVVQPVILSGGSGTRLWPLSRTALPKQMLALTGDTSMIAATAARVADRARFLAPLVVTGGAHAALITEQLGSDARLLIEPAARNTAPAIALATLAVAADDPDRLLLVMPSDHRIANPARLHDAIAAASAAAADGWLVTFGIHAGQPETGYGYIRIGDAIDGRVFAAARFVEKPDRVRAQAMVDDGQHVWNSGMFLFSARAMLAALARHAGDVLAAARAAVAAGAPLHPDATAFAGAPVISIDNAVFELADRVAVCPVDPGWSDIGSWDALYDLGTRDAGGNVRTGPVVAVDVTNSYLRADGTTLAVVGISNLTIVATPDAVLVTARGRSQDVRTVAQQLSGDAVLARPAIRTHRWGEERSIHDGSGIAARRISLSGAAPCPVPAGSSIILLAGDASADGAPLPPGQLCRVIGPVSGNSGSVILILDTDAAHS